MLKKKEMNLAKKMAPQSRGNLIVMQRYKFFLLISFLILSTHLISKEPSREHIQINIQPKESSGQNITINFQVDSDSTQTPDFSIQSIEQKDKEWRISGPQQYQKTQVVFSNGKTVQKSSLLIKFELTPLKTGKLNTPKIQLKVNSKPYTIENTNILVKSLKTSQPSPRAQIAPPTRLPFFNMFDFDDEKIEPSPPLESKEKQLEVFVVADPSKTEVYEGELITLPFYIYTNENIFRNLEFGSFPTFKDFLKEQLYIPKNWRPERTQYRNNNYYKSEIIRFALFPIKTGELLIDPLKMRFEVDTDIFQLLEQIQNPQKIIGQNQTFMRSSGSIPIKVSPLPPKPVTITQKSIPVGQYRISLQATDQRYTQDEAFSLKFRIEGKGNIKGLEEPELNLPSSLQKSRTATNYEINDRSEGYKDFEMLIVPQEAGNFKISDSSWSYFDPEKKSYETLTIPSIELHIDPSSKRSAPVVKEDKKIIFKGDQDFIDLNETGIPILAWAFPISLYALAGFFFVQRKKRDEEDRLRKDYPWLFVERKIQGLQDQNSSQNLRYIEEWIILRFQKISKNETSFDELMMNLLNVCPEQAHSKINKLRELFQRLEAKRFGKGKILANTNVSFEEIKRLSEEIIYSSELASSLKSSESSEDT